MAVIAEIKSVSLSNNKLTLGIEFKKDAEILSNETKTWSLANFEDEQKLTDYAIEEITNLCGQKMINLWGEARNIANVQQIVQALEGRVIEVTETAIRFDDKTYKIDEKGRMDLQ